MQKIILEALQFSLSIYQMPTYMDLFERIAARKKVIGCVYAIYKKVKPSKLAVFMVVAYGIKAGLSVKKPVRGEVSLVATAVWPNELKYIKYIEDSIGEEKLSKITYSMKNIVSRASLSFACDAVWHWKKLCQYVRIVGYISRRYDFMPACRSVETLTLYIRFRKDLNVLRPKAVLATSYYSPDATALFASASSLGLKTLYIAHAYSPPTIVPMQQKLDALLVPSEVALRHCCPLEKHCADVSFMGVDAQYAPLSLDKLGKKDMKIGIFLSSPANTDRIPSIVDEIQAFLKPSQLLIRMHPTALAGCDLKAYVRDYTNMKITFGTPLEQDMVECDFGFIGASSVALQLLRSGMPCIYMHDFEFAPYDYCGFVRNGIIPEVKQIQAIDVDVLQEFYQHEAWINKFKAFDPFYGQDISRDALLKEFLAKYI